MQSVGKLGDRHIGAAEKAVASADNSAYRRDLPLRGQEKVDDAGQGAAKQHQKQHIQQQQRHIRSRQIPAHLGKIQQADGHRAVAHQQGGQEICYVITQRQCTMADGRHGQVPPGARGLVLHHQHVGAEGYRHTADRQQRGHQLSAHAAADQRVRHRGARGLQRAAEGILINASKKGSVKHQQDQRGDEGCEKHPLVPEIQLGIPFYKCAKLFHFPAPPVSFLPVTARNTSSIRPLVIS